MTTEEKSPVYFASLTVGNVKCFKEEQTIDLTNKQGNFAQWTVILGNNNTGKTTLLQCLAGLEAVPMQGLRESQENNTYYPISVAKLLNQNGRKWIQLRETIAFSSAAISSKILVTNKPRNTRWGWKNDAGYLGISNALSHWVEELKIYSYGVNRKTSTATLSDSVSKMIIDSDFFSSFFANEEPTNIEEWMLQTYLAEKNGVKSAGLYLEKVKKVLISGVLPDVKDLSFETSQQPPYNTYILFDTDYGKLRLHELGYGYQSSISWLGDLMKRQFDRYPDSENPLAEPAIVLVDEIDMHLHPEWQRKIIQFLSHHFPKTQFIVTSHSPLVVQSAENVNVVLLTKEGDKTIISQPDIKTFKGWTVVEILEELMGLEGKTRSEYYLQLIQQFDEALDQENAEQAVQLYEKLSEILHPASTQRKLLRIQMAGLTPKPL
jgi:predicted ATP-binding protein involved in virulence